VTEYATPPPSAAHREGEGGQKAQANHVGQNAPSPSGSPRPPHGPPRRNGRPTAHGITHYCRAHNIEGQKQGDTQARGGAEVDAAADGIVTKWMMWVDEAKESLKNVVLNFLMLYNFKADSKRKRRGSGSVAEQEA